MARILLALLLVAAPASATTWRVRAASHLGHGGFRLTLDGRTDDSDGGMRLFAHVRCRGGCVCGSGDGEFDLPASNAGTFNIQWDCVTVDCNGRFHVVATSPRRVIRGSYYCGGFRHPVDRGSLRAVEVTP